MNRYYVSVTAMQPLFVDVAVDAESEEEALQIALRHARAGNLDGWSEDHELEDIDAYIDHPDAVVAEYLDQYPIVD